jgi:site-specific DNA-methyltransferase (adenine-specific)
MFVQLNNCTDICRTRKFDTMPISEVFCEDNMAGMARYPDGYFHLAIVDPPYGAADAINPVSSAGVYAAKRGNYKEFKNQAPPPEYFAELKRVSKYQIIWGGNFFPEVTGGVIVWNKNGTAFGEAEVAICTTHKSVKIFEYTWNGMLQQNMSNKEHRIHPTQKPVALYKWLLTNYAKPGDRILDTHLGSGSHRIAAWDMGFDFWAWENDPDYFAAMQKRFEAHIAKPVLFAPEEMYQFEQAKLFD